MPKWSAIPLVLIVLLLGGCLGGGTPNESGRAGAAGRRRASAGAEEAPETSLPAPHETDVAPVKPAEEPSPPEISYYEAVRQITRLYPAELRPLILRGRMPILLHDLDRDRNPECFALAISSRGLDSREAGRLDDASRLFQDQAEPVAFSLLVFANRQGNFRRVKILPLGERKVFESLRKTPLYTTRSLPVIVTVSFQTQEGREVELFVFDNASGLPRGRQSLAETLSRQFRLEDIDGNGMIDLFVKEGAMEEGTGFETFLKWYRWNGHDFVEYQNRNVVRNLNAFLLKAKELVLAGKLQEAVNALVDPTVLGKLRKAGLNNAEILIRIMGLEELGLVEFPALREVVFPQVLEDPFVAENDRGLYFTISYRMIDVNGTSYIANARVYMLSNPFRDRQFAFAPPVD